MSNAAVTVHRTTDRVIFVLTDAISSYEPQSNSNLSRSTPEGSRNPVFSL